MAVPTVQGLRILDALRSGDMTLAEGLNALEVIDDGRPVPPNPELDAFLGDYVAGRTPRVDEILSGRGAHRAPAPPTPERQAERIAYIRDLEQRARDGLSWEW